MRKTILKVIVLLAIPFAMVGLPSGDTYAEEVDEGIMIFITRSSAPPCRITNYKGDRAYDKCEGDAASRVLFNNETNTLTLNSDGNDIYIEFDYTTPTSLTIESNGDYSNERITIAGDLNGINHTIIFDLNGHTYNGYISGMHHYVNLVVNQNSILNLNSSNYDTLVGLTINGGELNLNSSIMLGLTQLHLIKGKIKTDGGIRIAEKATVESGSIEAKSMSTRNTTINGGKISILSDDPCWEALEVSGDFIVNGGQVFLQNQATSSCDEPYTPESKVGVQLVAECADFDCTSYTYTPKITVNDGQIEINGFEIGLEGEVQNLRQDVQFNGGVTSIKNSAKLAFSITSIVPPSGDDLIFGNNMGIEEKGVTMLEREGEIDGYYIYEKYIPAVAKATIKNLAESDDSDNESDIKVPDTGTINSKEGSALAIFTATTFIILGTIMAVGIHKKHTSGHFKYDK